MSKAAKELPHSLEQEGRGESAEGHAETQEGDGFVHDPDCGGGFLDAHVITYQIVHFMRSI